MIGPGRLWRKFRRIRRESGLLGGLQRFLRNRNPIHLGLAYKIQACELGDNRLADDGTLTISRCNHWDDIPVALKKHIFDNDQGPRREDFHFHFASGCVLWIGEIDGELAGVCWRNRPRDRADYFVPLTKTEATIFACFVVPKFRGRNVYPLMLQRMIEDAHSDGLTTIFINCKRWNLPSIRGIEKAGFQFVGSSWIMLLHGKAHYFWNRCRQD